MRHILIPTDFTVQSLQVVHAAVAKFGDEKIRITLLHMVRQPNDIASMLFASIRNKVRAEQMNMVSEDFKETCEMLKNSYKSKLESIQIKFAVGDTAAFLRNYLEGANVDCIVYSDDAKLSLPSKDSVAMMPLINKCKYHKMILPSVQRAMRHQEEMQALTGNEMKVPSEKEVSYVVTK